MVIPILSGMSRPVVIVMMVVVVVLRRARLIRECGCMDSWRNMGALWMLCHVIKARRGAPFMLPLRQCR